MKDKHFFVGGLGVVLFILLVVLLFGGHLHEAETDNETVTWIPDGVISSGEYSVHYSGDGLDLYLRVENESLMVGIMARTRGWVAVGFGGGPGMKDTDIVIAYVLPNGTVRISDEYSTGFSGPHNPDRIYGGSFDITSYGGKEENVTVVEFSRPLKTGDRYDFQINLGEEFRVVWAYGSVDDFLSMHSKAGSFRVKLGGSQ